MTRHSPMSDACTTPSAASLTWQAPVALKVTPSLELAAAGRVRVSPYTQPPARGGKLIVWLAEPGVDPLGGLAGLPPAPLLPVPPPPVLAPLLPLPPVPAPPAPPAPLFPAPAPDALLVDAPATRGIAGSRRAGIRR